MIRLKLAINSLNQAIDVIFRCLVIVATRMEAVLAVAVEQVADGLAIGFVPSTAIETREAFTNAPVVSAVAAWVVGECGAISKAWLLYARCSISVVLIEC